ncbi:MAG: MATE family efflux transporter [Clostridium sp.]
MKKLDLTKGDILKLLLVVAIPSIITGLLQFTYNIVDMLFLGRFLGSNALAAIGATSLYINYGVAINFMVVVGLGVKISHSLGTDNKEDYYKYLNAGILINAIVSIVFFVAFFFFNDLILSTIDINSSEVYDMAKIYMQVYSFIFLFSFFSMLYTRIMGSCGLADKAMKINALGVVINLILDPLFIYVFKLGVFGAALGTLISNMVVTIIFVVKYKDNLWHKKDFGIQMDYLKNIFKIGYPYSVQRLIFSQIGLMLTAALVQFGDAAMAAQKLAFQIESVTLMVIFGLLTATSAFVGQNYGAKKIDRIHKGFHITLLIGIIYSIITSALFILFSDNIVKLFVTDAETIKYASLYLKYIAYGQVFTVLEMVSNGFYTGIGKSKIPTTISVVITPIRLLFAYYIAIPYGIEYVYIGILVTTIMKGIASYGYYRIKFNSKKLEAI